MVDEVCGARAADRASSAHRRRGRGGSRSAIAWSRVRSDGSRNDLGVISRGTAHINSTGAAAARAVVNSLACPEAL